ncbi:MAG: hypothetical protein U1F11_06695 [Steroidobacteraceae bacterium]
MTTITGREARPAAANRRLLAGLAMLALAALAAPHAARAQTASIYGSLGNFDVANLTGHDACGFEVELQGVTTADVGGGFNVQRYGAPTIEPFAGGVYVRWRSPIDPVTHACAQRTVAHPSGQSFGGTCYQWNGPSYDTSGCEHFGVWLMNAGAPRVLSRWLAPDPAAPDRLAPVNPPVAIAMPVYDVLPPVRAGDPPQVEVRVEAPEPAEAPELYGDAQWMRVFVVQVPREVTLDELVSDNTIVPQDLTQLESDWQIIQAEPASGTNGNRRQRRNQGGIDPTTRTVIRRIEMHEFTGSYDPVTHEALCADLLCNAPAPDEIGQMISAQMTAVLVQSDSVTVTRSGNGQVDSADKRITCGNKCVAPYDAASAVTLTAKAASGSTFAGWSGACTGAQSTCSVIVNGHVDVGARFALLPTGGGGGGGGGVVAVGPPAAARPARR